jgi:hypothetical protein
MPDADAALFTFRDPRAPQWALFILGLALLAGGALLTLILVIEGVPTELNGDAFAAIGMLGTLGLGGFAATVFGLRSLIWSPEWQVTATHAVRRRGTRVLRTVVLSDAPAPTLMQIVRYGQVISVRVTFGKAVIVAPNLDIAHALVDVWRRADAAG